MKSYKNSRKTKLNATKSKEKKGTVKGKNSNK